MLGRIIEIEDNTVIVGLEMDMRIQPNMVNLHVVFEDNERRVVGEIVNVSLQILKANIVGEITETGFLPGSSAKPSFRSKVRLINKDELILLLGDQELKDGYTNFGTSNVYKNYRINVSINEFFNNHFAILGNTGSGKSCTIASIFQKLFLGTNTPPINANMFFFDAYGEYNNAFSSFCEQKQSLDYKMLTTNIEDKDNLLRIPVWLLDVDDFALLLDVESPTQLPIIEKMLNLVPILTGTSENVMKNKNDIIARALQDILLSGMDSTKIRDQVIGILTRFNTPTLNLESQIVQPGYTRTLKQCLYIDKTGKMQEMELVVEFIRGYIIEEKLDISEENKALYYTLDDLENAMDFALISEGMLKSDKVFDNANVLSVRLHSLAKGENRVYFDYPKYVSRDEFIRDLTINPNTGRKCQIVNFNINYIDDRLAKSITKIISRMLFLKASTIKPRGSSAFHIVIEEAHRYVQHDSDNKVLGYNIFERITKEGRKYGAFLALITQRPSELSDTCVSQCANFIILRTLHPKDLIYIKEMVPNISQEVVLQLKNLMPGNCIAFGNAFKVPVTMYIDLPNPRPLSNNVDLKTVWYNLDEKNLGQQQNNFINNSLPSNTNDVKTIMQQNIQMASNRFNVGGNISDNGDTVNLGAVQNTNNDQNRSTFINYNIE